MWLMQWETRIKVQGLHRHIPRGARWVGRHNNSKKSELFPSVRHCGKPFKRANPLDSHNPMKKVLLLFPLNTEKWHFKSTLAQDHRTNIKIKRDSDHLVSSAVNTGKRIKPRCHETREFKFNITFRQTGNRYESEGGPSSAGFPSGLGKPYSFSQATPWRIQPWVGSRGWSARRCHLSTAHCGGYGVVVCATHLQLGGRPEPCYLPQRLETEDAARVWARPGVPKGQGLELPFPPLGTPGTLAGPGPGSGELKPAKQAVPARPPFSASRAWSAGPTVPSGCPTAPGSKVPPSNLAPSPLTSTRWRRLKTPGSTGGPPLPSSELSAEPGGSGWEASAREGLCADAVTAPAPRPPPAGQTGAAAATTVTVSLPTTLKYACGDVDTNADSGAPAGNVRRNYNFYRSLEVIMRQGNTWGRPASPSRESKPFLPPGIPVSEMLPIFLAPPLWRHSLIGHSVTVITTVLIKHRDASSPVLMV